MEDSRVIVAFINFLKETYISISEHLCGRR